MARPPGRRLDLLTVLVHAGLAVGLAFVMFPVLWMIFSSLKSNTEIFALPQTLFPKEFTVKAYQAIFGSSTKIRFFINSYLVAGAVTLLTLLVAILAAFGFSRYTFRGRKSLNAFIISTQTVPPITLLIPYFGLVVAFRLFDTYYALILTYMVFTLPYAILMMTGYLNTLPRELDEAVLVDGGSSWTALWRVLVAGLDSRDRGDRRLHLPARVERVPLRPDPDQVDGDAHGAHRHPAPDGTARLRLERDDGDERARIAAARARVPRGAAILPRRSDRRLREGLNPMDSHTRPQCRDEGAAAARDPRSPSGAPNRHRRPIINERITS